MSLKTIYRVDRSGVEYEVPVLPRDIFFSKLSYAIFTFRVSTLLVTCEMLFIGFLLCSVVRSQDGVIGTLILGVIVMLMTGLLTYLVTRDAGLTKTNELSFLKEVITVKPGLDNRKWNTIASTLNPVFFENCSSATPYFFYDGEACASAFTRYYLAPYYWDKAWHEFQGGQPNESHDGQRNESIEQVTSNTVPVAPVQRKWKSYSELSPFIAEAVHAYEESLEIRWNEMTNGSSSV